MTKEPGHERPFTLREREQVSKWLLIWFSGFSLLLGASAFTPNGLIIGPILGIPGWPLVLLYFGYWPYEGAKALMLFPMAPWLVFGLPAALWVALKLTQSRFLPSMAVAALLFSLWSSIVQIAVCVRHLN